MNEILSILMKYLIGLLGITVVVVVHEIGHLVAARSNGIEIEVFSFGIGPKLWGKLYKGCEYRISLLPLGGYCRLKGSDDLSQALLHDRSIFTHTEEGSLFSVHPLRRFFTYLAGPLCNFLFAVILYALLAVLPMQHISTESRIATIEEYPELFSPGLSAAYRAGLRTGDLVVSLNGETVVDWEDLEDRLLQSERQATFGILRDDEALSIEVQAHIQEDGTYAWGLTPVQELIVGTIRENSEEYRAGLRSGDRILKAQSIAVNNQLDLLTVLADDPEKITLFVSSQSGEKTITFSPRRTEGGKTNLNFTLRTTFTETERQAFSLLAGASKTREIILQTISSLRKLVRGEEQDIRSSVTGMARSAYLIGDITTLGLESNRSSGLYAILYLMGIVSISLALTNLLPLPAFDGGQMLIALCEWISQRQLRPRTYYRLQLVGIALVVGMFILLMVVDLRHFLMIRR